MNRKRICFSLRFFSLILVMLSFLSCEFFNFNGDIRESIYSDLQVTYSFYEIGNPNTNHEDITFQVGQFVLSSSFPQFTQEENLLVGWRFLKYSNVDSLIQPEGIFYGERNMITAITVGPAPLSFYGVWAKKRYVNFVTNCDTELEPIVTPDGYTIADADKYYSLTKERHAFRGWYLDEEFTQPFDIYGTEVTSDMTLYAKWVLQINITLNQNDGTGRKQEDVFDAGENYSLPDFLYAVDGKGFVGWSTSENAASAEYLWEDNITSTTDDITLYAVWTTDIVSITYYDNIGLDETVTINHYGRGARVPIGYYREMNQYSDNYWNRYFSDIWRVNGKSIKRYSTSSSASETDPDSFYQGARTVLTSSITLYAIWGLKTYWVEFKITTPGTESTYQYRTFNVDWGTTVTAPEDDPYEPGYVFTGWYWKHNNVEEQYDFNMILNEDNIGNDYSNLQLLAHFEAGESYQTVYYVNRNSNSNRNGTPAKPYNTISEAINAINARGDESRNYKILVKSDGSEINDCINISSFVGNSLIIKNENSDYTRNLYPARTGSGTYVSSPILTVSVSKPITIENIHFMNANTSVDGGAIRALNGANIVLNKCGFSYNYTSERGAGIYIASGASVTLQNVRMEYNNESEEEGGFIYNAGTVTLTGNNNMSSGWNKHSDIYLPAGKFITIASGFDAQHSSTKRITLPAESYVAGTKVLEIADGAPSGSYQKFSLNDNNWTIDSSGCVQPY